MDEIYIAAWTLEISTIYKMATSKPKSRHIKYRNKNTMLKNKNTSKRRAPKYPFDSLTLNMIYTYMLYDLQRIKLKALAQNWLYNESLTMVKQFTGHSTISASQHKNVIKTSRVHPKKAACPSGRSLIFSAAELTSPCPIAVNKQCVSIH